MSTSCKQSNYLTIKPSKIVCLFLLHYLYDKNGMMIAAKTLEEKVLKKELGIMFNNPLISYIQIHNANPGCYNCQVIRA